MNLDEILRLAGSYLQNSKDPVSLYKGWVIMYIAGDRRISDSIFKKIKSVIFKISEHLNDKFPTEKQTLYRGILLPPEFNVNDYKMWDYDHVSFTQDREIAETFSDINSKYGFIFPRNYVGHILEYNQCDEDHILFHYEWAEKFEPEFNKVINLLNQKEVLLGRI